MTASAERYRWCTCGCKRCDLDAAFCGGAKELTNICTRWRFKRRRKLKCMQRLFTLWRFPEHYVATRMEPLRSQTLRCLRRRTRRNRSKPMLTGTSGEAKTALSACVHAQCDTGCATCGAQRLT